jgi:transcriptional regulator with XRE-family HTH domain
MNEKWTGNLVGKMHNERVTYQDLADEMSVTKSYISMILNGSRKPKGIKERMEDAFASVVEKRKKGEE